MSQFGNGNICICLFNIEYHVLLSEIYWSKDVVCLIRDVSCFKIYR